ncbi:DUF3850 domain-containing protein [Vibrio parahaemolyticus]
MSKPNVHEFKIHPDYFALQVSGDKRFEVLRNANDVEVGDVLILNEWDGKNYTGRCITVSVTFILTSKDLAWYGAISHGLFIVGTSEKLETVL